MLLCHLSTDTLELRNNLCKTFFSSESHFPQETQQFRKPWGQGGHTFLYSCVFEQTYCNIKYGVSYLKNVRVAQHERKNSWGKYFFDVCDTKTEQTYLPNETHDEQTHDYGGRLKVDEIRDFCLICFHFVFLQTLIAHIVQQLSMNNRAGLLMQMCTSFTVYAQL